MPPRAAQRPAPAAHAALVAALEHNARRRSRGRAQPRPPHVSAPEPSGVRARESRRCSALDVNAGDWLPLDTKSANFDNIADAQALSPTLLESYLNAATAISRMAVGDRTAPTIDTTYTNPSYLSQHPWDHVEGAPYGTRGGMVVEHVFPGGRRVRVPDGLQVGRERAVRGHRHLDRRRARRAAQLRARAGGRRRRPRPGAAPDRADLRARRPAPGVGGVHPPDRRTRTRT